MKAKKIILIVLSVLTSYQMIAQENALYHEVQRAKQSDNTFQDISAALVKADADKNVLQQFVNEKEVNFFRYVPPSDSKELDGAINFTVPLKNREAVLELLETPMSYEVVTSNGQTYPANSEIKHYRGSVRGQPNSVVALTFYRDEIMGLIATDEGNFNIAKNKSSGKHLVFSDRNLKEKPQFACGTPGHTDELFEGYDPKVLLESFSASRAVAANTDVQMRSASNPGKYVRFYIETEYDIYQHFNNSTTNVEAYISGLMNQVRTLYQNENISTILQTIYIWTSNDPYNAISAENLLLQFQNYRTSITGDLGMLLTFRGNGGGSAAGYLGLCNSNTRQKLAASRIDASYFNVSAFSWSVYVITHEFGHLLGSKHTHACAWNGNNTAIDGCAEMVEGENGYGIGNCSIPLILPANGGTIMSYCHNTSVDINFNLGFGPQPGNVIRNSVNTASCLSSALISGPSTMSYSSGASFSVSNPPSGYTWTCSSNLTAGSASGNSKTFTANSTNPCNAWIAVKVGSMEIARKNISIVPSYSAVLNATINYGCEGSGVYYAYVYNIPSALNQSTTYFDWMTHGGWTIAPHPQTQNNPGPSMQGVRVTAPSPQSSTTLGLRACNACGCTDWGATVPLSPCSYYSIQAGPNPVSATLTVNITVDAAMYAQRQSSLSVQGGNVISVAPVFEVKLYNNYGLQVRQTASSAGIVSFDVSTLPNGIYLLHVHDGMAEKPEVQKIIVKH